MIAFYVAAAFLVGMILFSLLMLVRETRRVWRLKRLERTGRPLTSARTVRI